jgi:cysteine desulfurase
VTSEGLIDVSVLEALLQQTDGQILVSVMLANNETGVLQPMEDISALCKSHNALLHCDAIQAAGKIDVNFGTPECDMMSVSAHKIGGPQGIGALIVREGLPINSQQKGGGQELGRRGGTENVPAIIGFGVAADIAHKQVSSFKHIAELRDRLEKEIAVEAPGAVFFGKGVDRLANTVCVSMPGVNAELQLMTFDLANIAISAGSACSSGKVKPSHVLTAMGASESEAACAVRISLGWQTSEEEVARCAEIWKKLYRQKSPEYTA